MNINHKIRKDLIERSYPSPKHAAQILAYLHHNKKQVCSLSVISEQMRKSSPMTWPAAYDLAAMGKIGFADRRYHVFASHPDLKKLPLRQRIAVWHKDQNINVQIREKWASITNAGPQISRDQIRTESIQPTLFDIQPESMTNDELDEMIQRLKAYKITRDIEKRYDGAPTKHKAAITSVLTAYGVADPVALVHADEQITFLTLTNTKAMPLQVTIKQAGKPCETVYLEHITLYRAPVISAIQEAYKAATQRASQ